MTSAAAWCENVLTVDDLIYPVFVLEGGQRGRCLHAAGVDRLSIDLLLEEAAELVALGVPAVALFPGDAAGEKESDGGRAYNPDAPGPAGDPCPQGSLPGAQGHHRCGARPFTTHGQDGIIDDEGYVQNDITTGSW